MQCYAFINESVPRPEGGIIFAAGDMIKLRDLLGDMEFFGVTDVDCTIVQARDDAHLESLYNQLARVEN